MSNSKLTESENQAADQPNGYCTSISTNPWTWRRKLRCKLFPPQHCDLPETQLNGDVFVCRIISDLSMLDRLRVLFSGRVMTESRTVTEHMIGNHKTNSIFAPLPPRWMKKSDL